MIKASPVFPDRQLHKRRHSTDHQTQKRRKKGDFYGDSKTSDIKFPPVPCDKRSLKHAAHSFPPCLYLHADPQILSLLSCKLLLPVKAMGAFLSYDKRIARKYLMLSSQITVLRIHRTFQFSSMYFFTSSSKVPSSLSSFRAPLICAARAVSPLGIAIA